MLKLDNVKIYTLAQEKFITYATKTELSTEDSSWKPISYRGAILIAVDQEPNVPAWTKDTTRKIATFKGTPSSSAAYFYLCNCLLQYLSNQNTELEVDLKPSEVNGLSLLISTNYSSSYLSI